MKDINGRQRLDPTDVDRLLRTEPIVENARPNPHKLRHCVVPFILRLEEGIVPVASFQNKRLLLLPAANAGGTSLLVTSFNLLVQKCGLGMPSSFVNK